MENPRGLSCFSSKLTLNQPSVQEKINQSLSGVCLAQLNVMTSICTVPPINLHMHQNQSVRDQTESCNLEFNISLLRDRLRWPLFFTRASPWNSIHWREDLTEPRQSQMSTLANADWHIYKPSPVGFYSTLQQRAQKQERW